MHHGNDSRKLEPFIALYVQDGRERSSQFRSRIGALQRSFYRDRKFRDVSSRTACGQTRKTGS
jgi:hypothetical protein